MNKVDNYFEENILKLKVKLVIYRNVLANKNIKDHDFIGIILDLIYSNIITINEFLEVSKNIINYKRNNIIYLSDLDEEIENVYETLIENASKKETFRKNILNWIKKYIEYLNSKKKDKKYINILLIDGRKNEINYSRKKGIS